MRKIVDLPAPFGPTRPTFSPRNRLMEASKKRICLPCCLETESRRITLAAHLSTASAPCIRDPNLGGRPHFFQTRRPPICHELTLGGGGLEDAPNMPLSVWLA